MNRVESIKSVILILLVLVILIDLEGMEIPFSKTEIRQEANQCGQFLKVDPPDLKPETLKTNAWLWHDEDDLYVLFECQIDSSFSEGNISSRDGISNADWLRFQLITIPEAYYSYYYMAQPNGGLYDAVRSDSYGIDVSWNSSYSYTSTRMDTLWTVLMRIPLGELRFEQKLPYRWKMIVTRCNYQSEETFSFPPRQGDEGKDYFMKAEDIILRQKINRKLDLKLKPYFVKSYDLIHKTSSFDPEKVGLDIAFNPSHRTKIKIALNPDFSDIPPDGATDVYNSKYPVYLYENRFFFTEDINVFNSSVGSFYTRNIVQPTFAFKLTGNSRAINYGYLGALDKLSKLNGFVITPDDYFQVLALSPSYRRISLNNLLVSRMNKGYYNHFYEGAVGFEIIEDLQLNGMFTGSTTYRENDRPTQKDGVGGSLSIVYEPEELDFSVYTTKLGKDIAADAGMVYETDFEKWGASVGYDTDKLDGLIQYWGVSCNTERYIYEPDGERNFSSYNGIYGYMTFASKFNFSCGFNQNNDLDLTNSNHVLNGARISAGLWRWPAFCIYPTVSYGDQIVYALNDKYKRLYLSCQLSGDLFKTWRYSLSVDHINYDHPKNNLIYSGSEQTLVLLDNSYQIINTSLRYTPSPKTRISSGSGISTYESSMEFMRVSFYTTLRYEFRPDWFLYMGYQTRQTQDEKSISTDPLGHFKRNSASAYIKLTITI